MSAIRDNLISDWRAQLTAAETEPVAESPRRRWLARVRTRLYHFLLSLYGDGAWRAAGEDERATIQPTGVVFDASDAQALGGKPAKDIGKIRTVLKAVSNSQDHRPAAGTLTGEEVVHSSWLIVTSGRTNLSLPRCEEFLAQHGMACRKVAYGTDWALEVPAADHPSAWRLLEEHRSKLRKPKRVVTSFAPPREQASPLFRALAVLFAIPLVWFAVMALVTIILPEPQPVAEQHIWLAAALGGAATCWLAIVWAWFGTRRRRPL
jgi:hypothetical protein